VVVLCLDERYRTTLAHWLRSDSVVVEIADDGSRAKELLAQGAETCLSLIAFCPRGRGYHGLQP
jgi:hypothetical protein